MARKITLGLAKIEVGAIASDGDVATTFAVLGDTYEDTASITDEDPEITEHRSEEKESPIAVLRRKGKRTIAFSIPDPDLDTLVSTLGGEITGTSPNEKWEAPATAPVIEVSVKVTSATGYILTFPRVSLTGKINYELSRSGILLIEVSGDVLQPTKTGVADTIIA